MVVGERERAADLERDPERLANRQRPFALDELLQVLAVDVLEHDELPPVLLAAVDHCDDVRMVEPGNRARLATEALRVFGIPRKVLVEDLQRDAAFENIVPRAVDARHTSLADELLDLVPLTDQLADHAALMPALRGTYAETSSSASSQAASASSSSGSEMTSGTSTRIQFP